MKIKEIVSALERFAPLPLQDGFDNAGLQIGLTDAEATGALLCLDVTEPVIDEAIAWGCNLIIAHHPLLFKGYKSITGKDYVERCILKAIKNDIAIYAAHTNLDNVQGGVSFKIAEKLGLKNVRILSPTTHPYQEPAFDIYPLQNEWLQAGAGAVGELERPETELDLLTRIQSTFDVGCLKHTTLSGRTIRKVALCGGAGAFLIPQAIDAGADLFITGEIKYHDYFGRETEILLAEIGHYESEQYTKEIIHSIIRDLYPDFTLRYSKINTNPINYFKQNGKRI